MVLTQCSKIRPAERLGAGKSNAMHGMVAASRAISRRRPLRWSSCGSFSNQPGSEGVPRAIGDDEMFPLSRPSPFARPSLVVVRPRPRGIGHGNGPSASLMAALGMVSIYIYMYGCYVYIYIWHCFPNATFFCWPTWGTHKGKPTPVRQYIHQHSEHARMGWRLQVNSYINVGNAPKVFWLPQTFFPINIWSTELSWDANQLFAWFIQSRVTAVTTKQV